MTHWACSVCSSLSDMQTFFGGGPCRKCGGALEERDGPSFTVVWEGTVLSRPVRAERRQSGMLVTEEVVPGAWAPCDTRVADAAAAQALRQVCREALAPFRKTPVAPSPPGEFVWAGHVDGKSVRVRRAAPDALVVEEHLQGRDWAACDDELALHAYEAALLAKAGRP